MERSFAHDFGAVRVHADNRAHRATNALHARAFTVGDHIVLGPDARTEQTELIGHELAHVVQQRSGPAIPPGRGSAEAWERDASAAASQARAGHRALVARHGPAPAVQLDRRVFGAGQAQVAVENGAVTVNGQAINAVVGSDGRLLYNGREIVLDRAGVFRYRDRYTVCRPCNPDYYAAPRWTARPGTVLPEAQGSFYDPARAGWVLRNEPVVTEARLSPATPPTSPGPVDPALQSRVQLAQGAREQFEARVQRAMQGGTRTRTEAEQLVRQRMQEGVGEGGLGTFETGQTYAVAEEELGGGVVRRSTTGAVQGGQVATVAVPSTRLQARLAQINQALGENFVINEQTLNHAEVRAIVRTPKASVYYVNRDMCPSCQRFFLMEAMTQGRPITVVDPTTTRVFTPNRQIIEYTPSTVYERTAVVTRAGSVSTMEIGDHPGVVHSVRPVQRTGPAPSGLGGQTPEPSAGGRPTGEPAPQSSGATAGTSEPFTSQRGGARPGAAEGSESGATRPGAAEGSEPGATRPGASRPAVVRPGVVEGGEPGAVRPGTLGAGEAELGPIRPRPGRIRRFAVGAAGALAEGALTIALLLLDVVIQLIVVPYLERLQRQLEESYRRRLSREIQQYYDSYLAGQVESQIVGAANEIRAIEDRDAQPYVNTTVTVRFHRSWSFWTGQESGPPESIFDLTFDRVELGSVAISTTPVPESSDPLQADDPGWLTGDRFSTQFSQTVRFPAIPPTYQDLVNQYGADPAARSSCFIATACYGTPDAPPVAALRRFRDDRLLHHAAGRRFVRWYYRTSPPLADALWRHPGARRVVRTLVVAPLAVSVQALGLDRPPRWQRANGPTRRQRPG